MGVYDLFGLERGSPVDRCQAAALYTPDSRDAMERLREGRTSFIIAHRLSTVRNATTILVMEAGDVVESGSHEELLAAGGAYARLYESQWA